MPVCLLLLPTPGRQAVHINWGIKSLPRRRHIARLRQVSQLKMSDLFRRNV